MKSKKIIVAIGGNALYEKNNTNNNMETMAEIVYSLHSKGYEMAIVHGSGAQVGRLLENQEEEGQSDLDTCTAMIQGQMGYHLVNTCENYFRLRGKNIPFINLQSRILVDKNDEDFLSPSKPIGKFYSKEEAENLAREKGYVMMEDSGRGYRRAVASPKPQRLLEGDLLSSLWDQGIVICGGGGGIPVIEEGKCYKGVDAVVDKDLVASKIAKFIGADQLLIITGVDQVSIDFGKESQKNLDEITVSQAEKYIEDNQFGKGSMLPKILAALDFLKKRKDGKVIITSLEQALLLDEDNCRKTVIIND